MSSEEKMPHVATIAPPFCRHPRPSPPRCGLFIAVVPGRMDVMLLQWLHYHIATRVEAFSKQLRAASLFHQHDDNGGDTPRHLLQKPFATLLSMLVTPKSHPNALYSSQVPSITIVLPRWPHCIAESCAASVVGYCVKQ